MKTLLVTPAWELSLASDGLPLEINFVDAVAVGVAGRRVVRGVAAGRYLERDAEVVLCPGRDRSRSGAFDAVDDRADGVHRLRVAGRVLVVRAVRDVSGERAVAVDVVRDARGVRAVVLVTEHAPADVDAARNDDGDDAAIEPFDLQDALAASARTGRTARGAARARSAASARSGTAACRATDARARVTGCAADAHACRAADARARRPTDGGAAERSGSADAEAARRAAQWRSGAARRATARCSRSRAARRERATGVPSGCRRPSTSVLEQATAMPMEARPPKERVENFRVVRLRIMVSCFLVTFEKCSVCVNYAARRSTPQ